jgi:hypothetical protein
MRYRLCCNTTPPPLLLLLLPSGFFWKTKESSSQRMLITGGYQGSTYLSTMTYCILAHNSIVVDHRRATLFYALLGRQGITVVRRPFKTTLRPPSFELMLMEKK